LFVARKIGVKLDSLRLDNPQSNHHKTGSVSVVYRFEFDYLGSRIIPLHPEAAVLDFMGPTRNPNFATQFGLVWGMETMELCGGGVYWIQQQNSIMFEKPPALLCNQCTT
jgi:hypothetical protein